MTRRQFIGTVAAGAAAVSCIKMNTLNLQPLGIIEHGQFIVLNSPLLTNPVTFTYTAPANFGVELWTAAFNLTTSAAVGARQPFLSLVLGPDVLWSAFVNTVINATGSGAFWFGFEGPDNNSTSANFYTRIPRLFIPPTGVLTLSSTAAQLGDIYSAIALSGRAWATK